MTDHEWVDWIIERTKEGSYQWDPLQENDVFGKYYKGRTSRIKDLNSSRNKYNQLIFVFKPRMDKFSNAELLVYEERNRLEELVPRERRDTRLVRLYEKRYNQTNYYDGLGFLIGGQKNSKTYKIEKAILEQLEGSSNDRR